MFRRLLKCTGGRRGVGGDLSRSIFWGDVLFGLPVLRRLLLGCEDGCMASGCCWASGAGLEVKGSRLFLIRLLLPSVVLGFWLGVESSGARSH